MSLNNTSRFPISTVNSIRHQRNNRRIRQRIRRIIFNRTYRRGHASINNIDLLIERLPLQITNDDPFAEQIFNGSSFYWIQLFGIISLISLLQYLPTFLPLVYHIKLIDMTIFYRFKTFQSHFPRLWMKILFSTLKYFVFKQCRSCTFIQVKFKNFINFDTDLWITYFRWPKLQNFYHDFFMLFVFVSPVHTLIFGTNIVRI